MLSTHDILVGCTKIAVVWNTIDSINLECVYLMYDQLLWFEDCKWKTCEYKLWPEKSSINMNFASLFCHSCYVTYITDIFEHCFTLYMSLLSLKSIVSDYKASAPEIINDFLSVIWILITRTGTDSQKGFGLGK